LSGEFHFDLYQFNITRTFHEVLFGLIQLSQQRLVEQELKVYLHLEVPLFSTFFTASGTALVPTQPPIQWVSETLSLGIKQPGQEANHSPPSSAEVKNAWSYTSTPQYVFIAWCLVKHRDNFTFYLYLHRDFTHRIGVDFHLLLMQIL
jgi:hypothetical protein